MHALPNDWIKNKVIIFLRLLHTQRQKIPFDSKLNFYMQPQKFISHNISFVPVYTKPFMYVSECAKLLQQINHKMPHGIFISCVYPYNDENLHSTMNQIWMPN
jgi:hypothetical protein